MAQDILVVYPSVTIPVTATQELSTSPRVLRLRGEDFRAVDAVEVNDLPVESLSLVSQTLLDVTLPELLEGVAVERIVVYSNALSLTRQSLLRFQFGETTQRASGMMRLVQLYCKVLLTAPGRDIFSPQMGGDALKGVGRTFGRGQGQALVGDFVVAADRTTKQIIAIQARDPRIPRNERLLSARVSKAKFSSAELSLTAEIEVLNQAGQIGLANVTL